MREMAETRRNGRKKVSAQPGGEIPFGKAAAEKSFQQRRSLSC